jgi:hypothetical protein
VGEARSHWLQVEGSAAKRYANATRRLVDVLRTHPFI